MQDVDPAHENIQRRVLRADISGMHCANCVVAVELHLKALPEVENVRVSYPSGKALIFHACDIDVPALQSALAPEGYGLSLASDEQLSSRRNTSRDYLEIGAVFVLLAAVALALQRFHILPRGLSVSDQMSYGLVFIIGLVASVSSCLAVTGGLLVALAAKYNEANPYLTDGSG